MSDESERAVMSKLKSIDLHVDPGSVIQDARKAGLNVHNIGDFQSQITNYWRIEDLMNSYAGVAARYSAMSGAGAGVGGFGTRVTLGVVDIANMAAQLFRLGQRLAIVNGLDPSDEHQNEKITEIYLYALGFDAVAQIAIRAKLQQANDIAGKSGANSNSVLRLIIIVAGKMGFQINTKQAAKYIPIVGAFAGAGTNYAFAKVAAKKMIGTYKDDYFRTFQAASAQS
jgi:hypothetical protein